MKYSFVITWLLWMSFLQIRQAGLKSLTGHTGSPGHSLATPALKLGYLFCLSWRLVTHAAFLCAEPQNKYECPNNAGNCSINPAEWALARGGRISDPWLKVNLQPWDETPTGAAAPARSRLTWNLGEMRPEPAHLGKPDFKLWPPLTRATQKKILLLPVAPNSSQPFAINQLSPAVRNQTVYKLWWTTSRDLLCLLLPLSCDHLWCGCFSHHSTVQESVASPLCKSRVDM